MFNIAKFGPGSSVYGIATSDPLIKVWIALSPNNGDSYSIVVINKNPLGSPVSIQFNLNPTSKVAKMIFLDSPNGIGAVSGSKIGGVDFNNALDNYVTFPVTITNSKIAVSVKPGSASLIRVSAVDQGDLFTDSSRQIALPGLTVGSDGFYVCQTARFCRSDGERLGPMLLSVVLAVVAIASFF